MPSAPKVAEQPGLPVSNIMVGTGKTRFTAVRSVQSCRTIFKEDDMAQIALIIEDTGTQGVEIVKRLKAVVPTGVSAVSTAIDTGEPLFVRRLFDRRDSDFPNRLLAFFEWLESQSLSYKAFQVLDNDSYERSKSNQYYLVNADRLRTMIKTRKSSLDQQRQIGRLQEEDDE